MAQSIEERLLQAIKKDDKKAFDALMNEAQCGAYRLGRFPVLSLLYLYKSRRILSEYEEQFLRISVFEVLNEPIELSKKFSSKAGKCLRLYLDETVSPLEMLLILDRTMHLKRVYPLAKPSSAVRGRLKAIYSIKYSLGIKFVGDGIELDRRPLSYREKKKIASACLSLVLIIAIVIGVPVATVSLNPKPVDGEVTAFSQIDFNSAKDYTLRNDIVIPENYSVERVNCNFTGGGNRLIFGKGATLGEFNGKMSNLIIESSGDPLFSSLSVNASMEDVTVNVNADVTADDGTAFVVLTNYGRIDGVTVNVKGKLNAVSAGGEVSDEIAFGGIVGNNDYKFNNLTQTIYARGIINNCTVNYSQFSLSGESGANATFGGIAGINSGFLQNCTVNGEIIADTFDVAGVCSINNWGLVDNVNNANISQSSADGNWNPNTAGIVLNNGYAVQNCVNNGSISSVSTYVNSGDDETALAVISAGIACINSNQIAKCTNEGNVSATGNAVAYAGGIASRSVALISNCLSKGDITAVAQTVYAGGILGASEVTSSGRYIYFGTVDYCISEAKINVNVIGDAPAYAGGIVGHIQEQEFKQQSYDDNGNITEEMVYFGGGVTNSYFTGEYTAENSYFGAIVGVCGANIYESNSYSSGDDEFHNFDSNVYVNNFSNAFGATVKEDGSFALAGDKGATSATVDSIQNSEAYKSILSALTD